MKQKNTKRIPRKFVFIFAFLSIFIICIPIYYLTTYFSNRVEPFAEEIQTLEDSEIEVEKMKFSDFDLFNIKLEATKFDISKDYKASFKIYVSEENVSGTIKDNKIKYRIALAANWIGFYTKSSEYTINYKANGEATSTTSVYNLEPIANRTNYLIPFPKPTTYILISFDSVNDGKIYHHAYLLSLKYGTYNIVEGGFDA